MSPDEYRAPPVSNSRASRSRVSVARLFPFMALRQSSNPGATQRGRSDLLFAVLFGSASGVAIIEMLRPRALVSLAVVPIKGTQEIVGKETE
jgi:hypothetical protein